MLRVVIVGYGEMAASLMLGAIESGHEVVGVFRHEKVLYDPLYLKFKNIFNPTKLLSLVRSHKIYDIKARSVNSEEYKKEILKLNPDVVLVGSWGEILKKEAIVLPRMGTINCHPSMLPLHRGANPYYSVIKEGESQTGITFHLMDEKLDTGPILLQKEVDMLLDDTGGSLKSRCCQVARDQVKELLEGLETARILPKQQEESKSSYYQRINELDIMVDFEKTSQEIYNKIRGMIPWNSCYIAHKRNFLKIKKASIVEGNELKIKNKNYNLPCVAKERAGRIIHKGLDWLVVSTQDGKKLLLEGLQLFAPGSVLFTPFYLKHFMKIGEFLK